MKAERAAEIAARVEALVEEVRDLAYDALAEQVRDPDGPEVAAARRRERELARAHRALSRAAAALRALAGEPPDELT